MSYVTNTWLCSNKLLLNIEKTNFVIFKLYKKKSIILSPLLCNNENSYPIIIFYYLSFSYIWLYGVGYDIQFKYSAYISLAEKDHSHYDIFYI